MEQRTCPMDFLYHDRWSVLLWPLRWSLGRVSLVSLPPICRPKWAKKKCRTKRHRLSFMFLSSAIAGVIKNQIIDFSRCFLIHAGQILQRKSWAAIVKQKNTRTKGIFSEPQFIPAVKSSILNHSNKGTAFRFLNLRQRPYIFAPLKNTQNRYPKIILAQP